MAVTIQMIETKEFKVRPSGYDPEEVDAFLDSIIDEFEDMQREIQQLRAASRKQAAPAPVVSAPDNSEMAQRILANAQRVADDTMAEARKDADKMAADAQSKADKLIDQAKKEATRLTDSLETLREAARDYRERFERLLADQQNIIDAEKELFK